MNGTSEPRAESEHEGSPGRRAPLTARFVDWTARRSGPLLVATALFTAAMAIPFLGMRPEETASQEPPGLLFEAQRLAADRFAGRAFRMVFVVEGRNGDMLAPAPLRELHSNIQALRADARVGPLLLEFELPYRKGKTRGVVSITDTADDHIRAQGKGSLAKASDDALAASAQAIIDMVGPDQLWLSAEARKQGDPARWRSPAFVLVVFADNEKLGGKGRVAALGAKSTRKEQFARDVQQILRGEERHLKVWGLALDVNLTSAEQGRAAGPFLGLTVLAVLLLVGLIFRSYFAVAVVGLALGCLMLWLKGLSNLIGLKDDIILTILVPIAMISFGVDFAFHSIGRIRETPERAAGDVSAGYRLGIAGAMGALLLAMGTDAVAFLANATSSIEALVQFGVAAALATVSAFILLGLISPLLLMRIERRLGRPDTLPGGLWPRLAWVGATTAAGLGAMTAVLFMLFVNPGIGVGLLGAYCLLFVLAPQLFLGGQRASIASPAVAAPGGGLPWLGDIVLLIARRRVLLLLAAAALTAGALFLGQKVSARFDVKEFFSPDSDFVVGLDRFDRHFGARSGEPALIYIEGKLGDPAAVRAIRAMVAELRASRSPGLARDREDRLQLEAGLVELLETLQKHPDAQLAITKKTGVALTDMDQDGVFDTPEQLDAVYRTALEEGLHSGGRAILPRHRVRGLLWRSPDGERVATKLDLRIPGTRSQERIALASGAVNPLVKSLGARLRELDPDAKAVFTGQPIARQATLDAVMSAFRFSLLVALGLCFLLAAIFMRSIRYALVSVVPILLVVAWLNAFMFLAGYNLNVVTATIGAISIGVGIDFAVHFVMRFQQELRRGAPCEPALAVTGASTGGALMGSALSSVVGFAILAFAPMPMFSSFGLLTAVMILMAAVATLLVLPSLLLLVTPKRRPGGESPPQA